MSSTTEKASKLDQETLQFLDGFSKLFASISSLSIPLQREKIKELFCLPEHQLEPVAKIEDKVINGKHGPINVRLFIPKQEERLPVIVYLHRGGWVYGSIQESEVICRRLANEAGAIVAAVEYRLSPEYKFPVPLEDCYEATKWISEHASSFLGDTKKLIICGESAGGNLAAAVALMATQKKEFKLAGQLLIYPVLTNELDKTHFDNSPDKSLLSFENMRFFWQMYLSSLEDGDNSLASPLKSKNFEGVPPAFVITAEHDALKHEGAAYAEALRKSDVSVKCKSYPEVIHGFLDLPLNDTVRTEALSDIVTWIIQLHA